MQRNIKLILEYEGTNYHGWQSQAGSGRKTVQETVERAIRELGHEEASLFSSGRTDAGVHALGHVANFITTMTIPPEAWAPALNHILPSDIRVLWSEEVSLDFHARYSASGKTYKYVILNRHAPSALHRNRAWHVPVKLNLPAMKRAAKYFLGTHDFSAFRASACSAKSPVRSLKTLMIKKEGDFIEILLAADAFLQHMARNIVGTFVEVGLGRFKSEEVKRILATKDRRLAGRTAPPQGLYLVEVYYKKMIQRTAKAQRAQMSR
ncbi:MAG TPA: tRNA pseudouridine(38-40) synthase TruA [Nitrospirota bacterium]|nr:tRNA pseudouridine(38-40) synthase TruA [Nitrospirota bacterium]